MVKFRRSVDDYTPEAYRFEEWLRTAHGETVSQIADIDQLIERLEEWLNGIDVYGSQQGRFAKALLSNLLSRNLIPTKRPKEIDIIRDFLVDRSGRKWLRTEEGHLERMYKSKKVSVDYVSRELGRSKRAIYSKAKKLGFKRPKGAMTTAIWKKQQKALKGSN